MPQKKFFFLFAVFFALLFASFFAQWIEGENFAAASYAHFLLALYFFRSYIFCVLILFLLNDFFLKNNLQNSFKKNCVFVFFQILIFSFAIAQSIFLLCGFSFNQIARFSKITSAIQTFFSLLLFLIIALSFFKKEKSFEIKKNDLDFSVLSKREKEVAKLLLKGKTNFEIAQELFICEATVKTHIQNIYKKFSAKNRMDFAQKIFSHPFE